MEGVILGMPGPWADNNYEAADHYTTKIGGIPDWPFPPNIMKPDFLECSACQSKLSLIMQVYAPVSCKSLEIEERVIYIFGCLMPQCESTPVSWRALRLQKPSGGEDLITPSSETVPPPASSLALQNNDWRDDLWSFDCGDDDNEMDDSVDLEELSRAFSEAANLTSTSKKQNHNAKPSGKPLPGCIPTSSVKNEVPVIPCFYTYSEEERLSRKINSVHSENSFLKFQEKGNNHDDDSHEEKWEAESYEYDRALHADRTYLKFMKRLEAHPAQCFRYSYGGKPLLASGGVRDPGTCSLCAEPRRYEMQLMPPLIYFLQEAANDEQRAFLDKFNWMTLIVYTCSKSCSYSSCEETSAREGWVVAEEAVIVQYE